MINFYLHNQNTDKVYSFTVEADEDTISDLCDKDDFANKAEEKYGVLDVEGHSNLDNTDIWYGYTSYEIPAKDFPKALVEFKKWFKDNGIKVGKTNITNADNRMH